MTESIRSAESSKTPGFTSATSHRQGHVSRRTGHRTQSRFGIDRRGNRHVAVRFRKSVSAVLPSRRGCIHPLPEAAAPTTAASVTGAFRADLEFPRAGLGIAGVGGRTRPYQLCTGESCPNKLISAHMHLSRGPPVAAPFSSVAVICTSILCRHRQSPRKPGGSSDWLLRLSSMYKSVYTDIYSYLYLHAQPYGGRGRSRRREQSEGWRECRISL